MDALILRVLLIAVTLLVSTGASHRTQNFLVTASSPEEARTVGEAAEEYRRRLAIFWTGQPLADWQRPCTIKVRSGSYGAAGQTTFQFVGNSVSNWKMMVQGSSERILDSVLPHEVNHTIFASHFRRPLPRWADEGASTLFEHRSEQRLQLDLLQNIIRSRREYIPLRRLLSMKQYPTGHRKMLILYAEGFGLVDFLMQQGGRQTYLKFLSDARSGQWEAAIRKHYNHEGVEALEKDWRSWVVAGMPRYGISPEEMIATLGTETRDVARPPSRQPKVRSVSGRRQQTTPRRSSTESRRSSSQTKSSTWNARIRVPDASRELSKFKEDRRFSLQAPTPSSKPVECLSTNSREPQPKAIREFRRRDSDALPFLEDSQLQPTNHQKSKRRQQADASGLWKRSEETGSIPQWAGFPGQKGLF
jgi:hypothetical protein